MGRQLQREETIFRRGLAHRVTRFRQTDLHNPASHDDALEFRDGTIVKVNELAVGQGVRVVQLPAEPKAQPQAPWEAVPETAELVDR